MRFGLLPSTHFRVQHFEPQGGAPDWHAGPNDLLAEGSK